MGFLSHPCFEIQWAEIVIRSPPDLNQVTLRQFISGHEQKRVMLWKKRANLRVHLSWTNGWYRVRYFFAKKNRKENSERVLPNIECKRGTY